MRLIKLARYFTTATVDDGRVGGTEREIYIYIYPFRNAAQRDQTRNRVCLNYFLEERGRGRDAIFRNAISRRGPTLFFSRTPCAGFRRGGVRGPAYKLANVPERKTAVVNLFPLNPPLSRDTWPLSPPPPLITRAYDLNGLGNANRVSSTACKLRERGTTL